MIFIDNKYTRWYYNIVTNAKSRISIGYTEKHHIIPKSCGGNNSKNNLVALTAREHFVCHLLLIRMVEVLVENYQKKPKLN
jgi:cellobiose-specific phosphotransferase system component IIA